MPETAMPTARIGLELNGPQGERIRLTDYLGRGAFGEVYKATGLTSGSVTAVKLLPINELEELAARTALLNEVEQAIQVLHPNVVRVLHVDRGSSNEIGPYVVMEFVSGGTLAASLKSQRSSNVTIPLQRTREMLNDIAQGARAINERLIHRDIKPDNILIDGTRLRLSDFGISKVIDERTRTLTFKGGQHVAYMAPEGWENQPNTFKLDVYSVGIVAYQIYTLYHPFEDSVSDPADWQAWRKAHLYLPAPDIRKRRPEVSLALAQLLRRMIAKRPDERPNWDEVLAIITSSKETQPKSNVVGPAVEAAVKRQQEQEKASLVAKETAEREARKYELYRYSCEELLQSFDRIVEEFNAQFQHGRIEVDRAQGTRRTYRLPLGGAMECYFFPSRETDISIRGKQLSGGGYLGIVNGLSANLLMLREGPEDLYGRWLGCLTKISALVADQRSVAARYGIEIFPFGFRDEQDFYQEIRWAAGGMHIFTYELWDDMLKLFSEMLETAFTPPLASR